jgi:hypothetical protein
MKLFPGTLAFYVNKECMSISQVLVAHACDPSYLEG